MEIGNYCRMRNRTRPSRSRSLSAGVLSLALSAAIIAPVTVAPAGAQNQTSAVSTTRYGGDDRYATALKVAEQVVTDAGGRTPWAVMVSGTSWPDAVVASSLAGALEGPLVLTPPSELPVDVQRFLEDAEVSNVIVVGSHVAPGVSAAVVSELIARGYRTERVAGHDRYTTSVSAAERLGGILQGRNSSAPQVGDMPGLGRTAIVASGEVFVDALVSGPVAALGRHPVLLTPRDRLHPDVAAYLTDAGVEHVVLMGGTAALDASVEAGLDNLGLSVTRLAGATRFDTAAAMADLVADRYNSVAGRTCFDRGQLGLARARVPFDSFSAAPLLARRCASLLLSYPRETNEATAGHLSKVRASSPSGGSDPVQLHVFGGSAAISPSVLDDYVAGRATQTGLDSASDSCGVPDRTLMEGEFRDRPRQFAWTADCSRVLIVHYDGSLWIANGDGSDTKRLLPFARKVSRAAWSPDERRIAFSANKRSSDGLVRHIHVINADGSAEEQLTEGAVNDDHPAWSSDGRRLVIQRRDGAARDGTDTADSQDTHLLTMDANGRNQMPLLQGGAKEHLPSWSPDGTRIAYGASDAIWVVEADGSDARQVTAASGASGSAWSPDGERIVAFWRRFQSEGGHVFVVAEVDGLDQQLVPLDARIDQHGSLAVGGLRWTSDGRRIVAHVHTSKVVNRRLTRSNWRYVIESPREVLVTVATCKPASRSGLHTPGFPLPSWAAPSLGTLRVALLFVDFPDASVRYSTEAEAASSLRYAEDYVEAMSYGKLDVEFVPHHTWLRAEREHHHYLGDSTYGNLLWQPIGEHAVELAEDEFDFSDIDAVMVVMPSRLFGGGGNEGGSVTADGNTMRAMRINHRPEAVGRTDPPVNLDRPSINPWGATAAHELMHSLGLADLRWDHLVGIRLWPIEHPLAPAPLPEGDYWAPINFGTMDLNGRAQTTGTSLRHRRLEMLSWSRWQLGWLGSDQVECIKEAPADVWLSPVADPGPGTAMAAVHVSANGVIVVESRRLLGHDAPSSYYYEQVAAGDLDPNYLAEGVLVYSVTPQDRTHPVTMAHDDGRGYLTDFPLLDVGESVRIAGYTITVVEDTGSEHLVSIRKNA